MIPALIICAALIVIYLLLFLDARRFVVKEERIAHEKIKEPFTIVQVSDLHDRRFGKNQEKLLAAVRAGITTVLVPEKNRKNVAEIEDEIKDGLEIIYVSHFSEVVAQGIVKRSFSLKG